MRETTADFTITMQPSDGLLPGTGRLDFDKEWTGGLAGTSQGLMLSAGDPASGSAGYVALEVFTGTLDDRAGSFAMTQRGLMADGSPSLIYDIAPGSGTDDLAGLTGTVDLSVDADGAHHVTVRYSL